MDIKSAVEIAKEMKKILDDSEALTPFGVRNRNTLNTLIDYCSEPKDNFKKWVDACPDKVPTIEEIREITKKIPSLQPTKEVSEPKVELDVKVIAKIIEEKIWERHEGCPIGDGYKECPDKCCYLNAAQSIVAHFKLSVPSVEEIKHTIASSFIIANNEHKDWVIETAQAIHSLLLERKK